MIKRMLHAFLPFLLFASVGTAYAEEHEDITISVNGEDVSFDVPPQLFQGRMFVPLRAITDALGVQITSWGDNTVTLTDGSKSITLTVGMTTVQIGEERRELDVAPLLHQGRTIVPIRFVSETFGAEVKYEFPRVTIDTGERSNESNARGNTTGNLNNFGRYVFHDGWIYFFNYSDEGRLYKKKPDRAELQKISEDRYVEHLNIVDGKLYYRSDYKIVKSNLDGTERVVLRDEKSNGLNVMSVVGEWIYFTEEPGSMFGKLYRMKTDGSAVDLLDANPVSRFVVDNGKIYYVVHTNQLFVMDTEGTNRKQLLSEVSIVSMERMEGRLIFNNNGSLFEMDLKSTEVAKLSDYNAQDLNVDDDWLYFSNHSEYSKKLFRLNLVDGTVEKLSDKKAFHIHVAGGRVFFNNPDAREEVAIPFE